MAEWPDLDELKQKLDVTGSDWDTHLSGLLDAAIEQVQFDVGEEVDDPSESLAKAALLLAINLGTTDGEPDVTVAARLPKYLRLIKGHRVRFGVA